MMYKNLHSEGWTEQQAILVHLLKLYLSLAYSVEEGKMTGDVEVTQVQRDTLTAIVTLYQQLEEGRKSSEEVTLWDALIEMFALGDFEAFALLVVLGAEISDDVRVLLGGLPNGSPLPSREVIMSLYLLVHPENKEILRGYFTFDAPLSVYLLEEEESVEPFFYEKRLKLRPYVRQAFLEGRLATPSFLDMTSSKQDLKPRPIFGNQKIHKKAKDYCTHLVERLHSEDISLSGEQLWIVGEKGIGKSFFAEEVARELGKNILFLDVKVLFQVSKEEVEEFIPDLVIHALLGNFQLCIEGFTEESSDYSKEFAKERVESFLKVLCHHLPFLIVCSERNFSISLPNRYVLMLKDWTATESLGFWREITKGYSLNSDVSLENMVNRYVLSPQQMMEVLNIAHLSGENHDICHQDFVNGVLQIKENNLGSYAEIIESPFTWSDMVLDQEVKEQLEMVCTQVTWRSVIGEEWGFFEKLPYGRGISVLFHGSPGTGKTMAAQALANTLQLELYRIDSSQLISKYIGETQKNIAELFEKAKKINAILFFDEADALFSKRSEVKDSNDKHANAETALLLQRFESYDGIVILASNHMNNMDSAFQRRIKFIVKFDVPSAEMREELWRKSIPSQAKVGQLNFKLYAENHDLVGSEIKEITLNAAFLAVSEQSTLENRHIERMIHWHYRKKGKPIFH